MTVRLVFRWVNMSILHFIKETYNPFFKAIGFRIRMDCQMGYGPVGSAH